MPERFTKTKSILSPREQYLALHPKRVDLVLSLNHFLANTVAPGRIDEDELGLEARFFHLRKALRRNYTPGMVTTGPMGDEEHGEIMRLAGDTGKHPEKRYRIVREMLDKHDEYHGRVALKIWNSEK